MECFHEVKVTLAIHLTPSRLENVKAGIDEQLSEYLMEYVDELGGVVISYSDVELVDANGVINFERPHVHFRVNARFLVFTPVPGSHIVGIVNKVGIAHIGLLVFGAFNASIPARAIRSEYNYDSMQEAWVNSEDAQHVIAHGSPVRFQVVSGSSSNEFYSITGSLRKSTCGPVSEVGADAVADRELDPLDETVLSSSSSSSSSSSLAPIPISPAAKHASSATTAFKSSTSDDTLSAKKRKADEPHTKTHSEKKARAPK